MASLIKLDEAKASLNQIFYIELYIVINKRPEAKWSNYEQVEK